MGLNRIVEEIIKKAMENGDFDNLPGKGKPLNLAENPHEPEDWRIAFHVLRNADVTLPWIETARQIENDLENSRRDALLARRYAETPADWLRHANRFRERIAEINRLILQYNLQVPIDRFQRPQLNAELELAAVENRASEAPPST